MGCASQDVVWVVQVMVRPALTRQGALMAEFVTVQRLHVILTETVAALLTRILSRLLSHTTTMLFRC